MIRLRPAVRDDKVAGVIYGDGCRGQVYGATTCVTHLSLGSDSQELHIVKKLEIHFALTRPMN